MENKKLNQENVFDENKKLSKADASISKEDAANAAGGGAVFLCPLCGSPNITLKAMPGGFGGICNSCGHVFAG